MVAQKRSEIPEDPIAPGPRGPMILGWFSVSLLSAAFQVLRNVAMKRLGHALDEYINVWGRFTFLLPFMLVFAVARGLPIHRAALRA